MYKSFGEAKCFFVDVKYFLDEKYFFFQKSMLKLMKNCTCRKISPKYISNNIIYCMYENCWKKKLMILEIYHPYLPKNVPKQIYGNNQTLCYYHWRFSASLMNMVKQELPNDYNLFDITGTYFWCPERKFDDSVMVSVNTNENQIFLAWKNY